MTHPQRPSCPMVAWSELWSKESKGRKRRLLLALLFPKIV